MGMIADVILTVAVVAVAAGAIAEFQFRIGDIRATANRADMVIGRLGFCRRRLIRTGGGEGDGFVLGGFLLFFPEQAGAVDTPRQRYHIQYILAEEQEIVQQRHQREQTEGENAVIGVPDYVVECQAQIHQSENPRLDGNDIEQKKLCVGIQCGVAQEQAEVQIVCVCITVKQHAKYVHHQDTGEIIQVKS